MWQLVANCKRAKQSEATPTTAGGGGENEGKIASTFLCVFAHLENCLWKMSSEIIKTRCQVPSGKQGPYCPQHLLARGVHKGEEEGVLQGVLQEHSCEQRQPFYKDNCHEASSSAAPPFHQVLTTAMASEGVV